jgi:hypothetical protein
VKVTATTEGLAVAEAVTVRLLIGFFEGVALVGLALVGVAVGVRSSVRSTSLGGTAALGGTEAPPLASGGWGMMSET